MTKITPDIARWLYRIRQCIQSVPFGRGEWTALGDAVGCSEIIDKHPRLYRSLFFGDDDYKDAIYDVLRTVYMTDPDMSQLIVEFLDEHYPETPVVSAVASLLRGTPEPPLTIRPTAFSLPKDRGIDESLVSVMIPFRTEFDPVYQAIQDACKKSNMKCLRVDDVWETATFIQDIFNLLYRCRIVVVDFTGRNPNVMYETGVAHTLGREVIPISQNVKDAPSNIGHHRILLYQSNTEGRMELTEKLSLRIRQFAPSSDLQNLLDGFDDEIPF